jgi:hypothetical protein
MTKYDDSKSQEVNTKKVKQGIQKKEIKAERSVAKVQVSHSGTFIYTSGQHRTNNNLFRKTNCYGRHQFS